MNLQFTHALDNRWNSNIVGTPSVIQTTNWTSNVIPGPSDDLLIPAGMDVIQQGKVQHYDTDDVAHTLTVANGASLSLQSMLTIGGDLINAGSTTITAGNHSVSVAGTISNDGILAIANSSTSTTGLDIASSLVRLTGGGQVVLSANQGGGGYIDALTAGSTLQNDSTILGVGYIGSRGSYLAGTAMTLVNGATGLIDGRGATQYDTLTITSGVPVLNHGILRGSGLGGLTLSSLVVQNADGTLDGNDGRVVLDATTIQGGTLRTEGAGAIVSRDNGTNAAPGSVLDGSTASGAIRNTGLVSGPQLGLKGSIVNSGIITEGDASATGLDLYLLDTGSRSGVTLTGGGVLQLYSNGNGVSQVTGYSATVAVTLHNVDNTIRGSGAIGTSATTAAGNRESYRDPKYRLALDNQAGGIINGGIDGSGQYGLTLDLSDGIANAGLIEATGGGELAIVDTTVTNSGSGAVLTAIGAGSRLDLVGATIRGGTIASSGGGVVNVRSGQNATVLDNTTAQGGVRLTGTLAVTNAATLRLVGTLSDTGTLLDQLGGTILIDTAGATINGAGSVVLGGGRIKGTSADTTATLRNGSTLSGGGFIGAGYDGPSDQGNAQLRIENQAAGTIVASDPGRVLTVQNLASFTNAGTLDAKMGGTLALAGDTVLGGGGTIHAATGSRVTLDSTIVYAGTYATDGTGLIEVTGNSPSTIDGASAGGAVTNLGTIQVDNSHVLALVGNVTNNGRILVAASDRTTQLIGGAVLTGSGRLDLSDSGLNSITGSLTNGTNTISGAGTISATLTNLGGGTIAATYADQALTLTGANLANDGVLKADGGRLVVTGAVTGAGRFAVANGGTLDIQGSADQAIGFQDRAGTVRLTQATGGAISGFAMGDRIDLAFLSPDGLTASYDAGTAMLTLRPTSGAAVSLKLPGFDDAALFRLASDNGTGINGRNGTLLTLAGDPAPRLTLGFGIRQAGYGHDAAGRVVITGPDGAHTLAPGVNLVRFTDGLVNDTPAGPGGLVDPLYYYIKNPDVFAAGIDAAAHYAATGWREGRSPNEAFDTGYYLGHNPDVKAAGINPLQHFHDAGWREGRDPSAAFSLRDYLAANPDVKAAGIDPLAHWLGSGRAEHRAAFAVPSSAPDPLVDAAYYYASNPDVKAAGIDASAHYLGSGYLEGRNPNAFFDSRYYLTQNPDVKAAGLNPLQHFEAGGWREGRQPSLVFDDAKYLSANPDVKAAGFDPLAHYLLSGQYEGRQSFLTGGSAAADPLVNAAFYDAQLGATLIPGGTAGQQQAAWSYDATGWQKGLNPDALFDTGYYLAHNPDVAAAHINPLAHYEANGWREGRDPSAAFSTNKYLGAYADVKAANLDPLLHYVVNGQGEGRTAFAV